MILPVVQHSSFSHELRFEEVVEAVSASVPAPTKAPIGFIAAVGVARLSPSSTPAALRRAISV